MKQDGRGDAADALLKRKGCMNAVADDDGVFPLLSVHLPLLLHQARKVVAWS